MRAQRRLTDRAGLLWDISKLLSRYRRKRAGTAEAPRRPSGAGGGEERAGGLGVRWPMHCRLLKNHAFGPDEITILTSAFDDALRRLRLADRADPATEVVARKIIELAQQGERDPIQLSERAIQALTSVRARVIP